jgi:hypothetical protein
MVQILERQAFSCFCMVMAAQASISGSWMRNSIQKPLFPVQGVRQILEFGSRAFPFLFLKDLFIF